MTPAARILSELNFGFLGPYKIAGMSEPDRRQIHQTHALLRSQGIGAIMTVTEDDLYGVLHRQAGFRHHHEPIDDTEPPTVGGMDRALAFIDTCLASGTGVAVHCLAGRGRTGTVLCAWLGRRECLSPEDAIRRISELRWQTVLTERQREFLHCYLDGNGRGKAILSR